MEKISIKDINNIDITNKVIVFPTDTVYGIGCKIDDLDAIKKIYEIKERDYSKPLAILCPNDNIADYVINVSDKAKELMMKYWPGALTIIYHKSEKINDLVTTDLKTVGFRMPNSKIALAVLNKFGIMATTSINKSGMPPLNDIESIEKEFGDMIDYIVIDKEKISGTSSTVVDATGEDLKVLRQGSIVIK